MKVSCLVFLLSISTQANAGTFVEKSLYVSQSVAVGAGVTLQEAKADALAAVPETTDSVEYLVDPKNSPTAQCQGGTAPDLTRESCGAATWQMTIPLVRVER